MVTHDTLIACSMDGMWMTVLYRTPISIPSAFAHSVLASSRLGGAKRGIFRASVFHSGIVVTYRRFNPLVHMLWQTTHISYSLHPSTNTKCFSVLLLLFSWDIHQRAPYFRPSSNKNHSSTLRLEMKRITSPPFTSLLSWPDGSCTSAILAR